MNECLSYPHFLPAFPLPPLWHCMSSIDFTDLLLGGSSGVGLLQLGEDKLGEERRTIP